MREDVSELADNLMPWLADARAASWLDRYFAGREGDRFGGRHFERIGGGGDHPRQANFVSAEDLVAVEMLSVQVPPEVAFSLLDGSLGRRMTHFLSAIPIDARLGDADARRLIEDGGAAADAWAELKQQDGVGWVIAGKPSLGSALISFRSTTRSCVVRSVLPVRGGRNCMTSLPTMAGISADTSDRFVNWVMFRSTSATFAFSTS